MNISIMIGLMITVIFAVGVLIGQGLNGRTQVAYDQRQARVQREINGRRRILASATRLVSRPDGRNSPFSGR